MAHFAKVTNGVVVKVIVADQGFVDNLQDANTWVQTSYNTHGGVHLLGGTPLRKNFAGIGYAYDSQKDAFIPPKPFNSWTLNEDSCLWEAPTAYPSDGKRYYWDENGSEWVEDVGVPNPDL